MYLFLFADDLSRRAVANVIGNINNHEFGIAKIYANVSRTETGTRTNGKFVDIPRYIGTPSDLF